MGLLANHLEAGWDFARRVRKAHASLVLLFVSQLPRAVEWAYGGDLRLAETFRDWTGGRVEMEAAANTAIVIFLLLAAYSAFYEVFLEKKISEANRLENKSELSTTLTEHVSVSTELRSKVTRLEDEKHEAAKSTDARSIATAAISDAKKLKARIYEISCGCDLATWEKLRNDVFDWADKVASDLSDHGAALKLFKMDDSSEMNDRAQYFTATDTKRPGLMPYLEERIRRLKRI